MLENMTLKSKAIKVISNNLAIKPDFLLPKSLEIVFEETLSNNILKYDVLFEWPLRAKSYLLMSSSQSSSRFDIT